MLLTLSLQEKHLLLVECPSAGVSSAESPAADGLFAGYLFAVSLSADCWRLVVLTDLFPIVATLTSVTLTADFLMTERLSLLEVPEMT